MGRLSQVRLHECRSDNGVDISLIPHGICVVSFALWLVYAVPRSSKSHRVTATASYITLSASWKSHFVMMIIMTTISEPACVVIDWGDFAFRIVYSCYGYINSAPPVLQLSPGVFLLVIHWMIISETQHYWRVLSLCVRKAVVECVLLLSYDLNYNSQNNQSTRYELSKVWFCTLLRLYSYRCEECTQERHQCEITVISGISPAMWYYTCII